VGADRIEHLANSIAQGRGYAGAFSEDEQVGDTAAVAFGQREHTVLGALDQVRGDLPAAERYAHPVAVGDDEIGRLVVGIACCHGCR